MIHMRSHSFILSLSTSVVIACPPFPSGALSTYKLLVAMAADVLRWGVDMHKYAESKQAAGSAFGCGHSYLNRRGEGGRENKKCWLKK